MTSWFHLLSAVLSVLTLLRNTRFTPLVAASPLASPLPRLPADLHGVDNVKRLEAALTFRPEHLQNVARHMTATQKLADAIPYYEAAANTGSVEAMVNLGKSLMKLGEHDRGVTWWKKAAVEDDQMARGEQEQADSQEKAANGTNAWSEIAMYELGILFVEGELMTRNLTKARFLFEEGSKSRRHVSAMYMAGRCAEEEENRAQLAADWYKDACEKGELYYDERVVAVGSIEQSSPAHGLEDSNATARNHSAERTPERTRENAVEASGFASHADTEAIGSYFAGKLESGSVEGGSWFDSGEEEDLVTHEEREAAEDLKADRPKRLLGGPDFDYLSEDEYKVALRRLIRISLGKSKEFRRENLHGQTLVPRWHPQFEAFQVDFSKSAAKACYSFARLHIAQWETSKGTESSDSFPLRTANESVVLDFLQRAARFDPTHTMAPYNAAILLFGQGKVEEATKFAKEVERISERNPEEKKAYQAALQMLHEIYMQRSMTAKARMYEEKLTALTKKVNKDSERRKRKSKSKRSRKQTGKQSGRQQTSLAAPRAAKQEL